MKRVTHTAPHDALLRAAISAAADVLPFNNPPGSVARQYTLGLFVAALGDRLALAFPESAEALHALVLSPATTGNPTQATPEHQQ
ncbi:hypothetical protein [Burkholderia gladioli]|uniref:hypothetical protein n=1 Tax=Burkholderia gladioli TaxID=28095 RepID=UPI00163F97DD|nr:hypothetical protein [Burkholderia gladioli]